MKRGEEKILSFSTLKSISLNLETFTIVLIKSIVKLFSLFSVLSFLLYFSLLNYADRLFYSTFISREDGKGKLLQKLNVKVVSYEALEERKPCRG